MPRYYCDYCDTYLTHDSPSVRKQHNAGYKHKANVRSYYQQFEEQQTQSLIDQRIKEHLGQTAAFQQQVGASFNQHLMAFQSNPQGPRFPVLAPPVLAPGGPMGSQLLPGIRPPVLPRPPGYGASPNLPPSMAPHGALQMGGLPRPPPPASNGPPVMYQANPTVTETGGFGNFIPSSTPGGAPINAPEDGSGGFGNFIPSSTPGGAPINAPEDGFSYPQSLETDH